MSINNNNLSNLFNQNDLLSAYNRKNKKDINGDGKVDQKDTALKGQLDVNNDGKVDYKDKTQINKEIKNLESKELTFDIDGDGKLNLKDVILANSGVDINGDGKVTDDEKKFLKDEQTKINSTFRKQKDDAKLDINGDGKVDIKDVAEFNELTKDIKFKNKYDSTSDILKDIQSKLNKKVLDGTRDNSVTTEDLGYWSAMQSSAREYVENKQNNKATYIADDFAKTNFDINGDGKVDNEDIKSFDSAIEIIEKQTGKKLEKLSTNSQFKKGQKIANDNVQAEKAAEKERVLNKYSDILLANKAEDVNGSIEKFSQGNTGDCWLLAGLYALSSTTAGAEIIKDSIKVNIDGSVTVSFKGLGVCYTVSPDEIKKHDTDNLTRDKYSNGDNDVLVVELAIKKLHKDIAGKKIKVGKTITNSNVILKKIEDSIDGGLSSNLIYYFTGEQTKLSFNSGSAGTVGEKAMSSNQVENALKNWDENSATIAFSLTNTSNRNKQFKATCTNGETFYLTLTSKSAHALAVKSVDKNNKIVTFINPWDSGKEYTMTYSEFAKIGIGSIEITKITNKKLKNDVKEMTDYKAPEIKTSTDESGNQVIEQYTTKDNKQVLFAKAIVDSKGNKISYKYDDDGSVAKEVKTNTDGTQVISEYKKSSLTGNKLLTKTEIAKDGSKTITKESENDSWDSETRKWTYSEACTTVTKYDKSGTITSEEKTTINKRDNIGQKTVSKTNYSNEKKTEVTYAKYDASGNILSNYVENYNKEGKVTDRTTTTNNSDGTKTVTKLEYQEDGFFTKSTTEIKYDKNGKEIKDTGISSVKNAYETLADIKKRLGLS